ncbi:MAG: polysaccharide deacetylase family protein [Jatrophihabitans sp.]
MNRTATATAAASAIGVGTYWTVMSSQSQAFGSFPNRGAQSAHSPTVALTFDDGPNEPFTTRLARILEARDVRATFFQVGRAVARCPDASRALFAAGHVLGNHSYSHDLHKCFTARHIDDEIRRAQDVFGEKLQLRPRLYRPPWLVRTPATFRLLRRHGMQPVSGTFCHPMEVAQPSGRRIAVRAVARATPGRMLIFHDGYNGRSADRRPTLDAVARTIDTLADRGWSFATVDQIMGVTAYHDVLPVSPAR